MLSGLIPIAHKTKLVMTSTPSALMEANDTMDPSHRTLIQVGIEDGMKAERRVSVLMGDKADLRRKWIEDNVSFTLEDNFKVEK